jgi:putative tricarboxylic transport membrane protein
MIGGEVSLVKASPLSGVGLNETVRVNTVATAAIGPAGRVKRTHQVASLVFAGIGVFLVFQGIRLRLEGQVGPGPGFFPFWIGMTLTLVSALWLAQVSFQPATASTSSLLPPRRERIMLIAVILALVAFMLLLRPIGFNLAMLGLLLFLFFVIDREHAVAKVVIAFVGSFGVHYVFEQLLRVPLPFASLSFLQQLGF